MCSLSSYSIKLSPLQSLHVVILPLLIVVLNLFMQLQLPSGDRARLKRLLGSIVFMRYNRILLRIRGGIRRSWRSSTISYRWVVTVRNLREGSCWVLESRLCQRFHSYGCSLARYQALLKIERFWWEYVIEWTISTIMVPLLNVFRLMSVTI